VSSEKKGKKKGAGHRVHRRGISGPFILYDTGVGGVKKSRLGCDGSTREASAKEERESAWGPSSTSRGVHTNETKPTIKETNRV